jgi:nucleoid DNA-binding protein
MLCLMSEFNQAGFGCTRVIKVAKSPTNSKTATPSKMAAAPAKPAGKASTKKSTVPAKAGKMSASKVSAKGGKKSTVGKMPKMTGNFTQFIAEAVAQFGMNKEDCRAFARSVIEEGLVKPAKKGRIAITGFGTFSPRAVKARVHRNPSTGAEIKKAAHKRIAFRASKELHSF